MASFEPKINVLDVKILYSDSICLHFAALRAVDYIVLLGNMRSSISILEKQGILSYI